MHVFHSGPLQILNYRQIRIVHFTACLDFRSSFLSMLLLLNSSLPGAATSPTPCITCFTHLCDKILDQGILGKGEFVFGSRFEGQSIMAEMTG